MAGYESDHTKFIRELKKKNPRMEEGQQKGRALLWDKQIDRDAQHRYQEAGEVPQQGYVYQDSARADGQGRVSPDPPDKGSPVVDCNDQKGLARCRPAPCASARIAASSTTAVSVTVH